MRDGVHEQWVSKTALPARSSHSKQSWANGQSAGWAAFDRKQRDKQCFGLDFGTEPYPPISSKVNSVCPSKVLVGSRGPSCPSARSFSSIVQSPAISAVLMSDYDPNCKRLVNGSNSTSTVGEEKEANGIPALGKLKEVHSWADDNLIADILEAVNNDFDQASTLLKSMAISNSPAETKTTNVAGKKSLLEESVHSKKGVEEEDGVFENKMNSGELKSGLKDCISNKTEETSEDVHVEVVLSGSSTYSKLISGCLISVPVEPEWEEDDVYLCHRRDAMRTIRSASQHSRAASNAFLRGDHFSAQQLSLKAQGEWEAAKKLNEKAAKEILSIRNSETDVWKLDLHGLHASEAVHALQDRLRKIETLIPLNSSASRSRIVEPEAENVYPLEPANDLGMMEKSQKKQAVSWLRPTVLQVITGTGKHSRGQASLPSAVRSFLIESGYRFDEARPGVIAVRPKFRFK